MPPKKDLEPAASISDPPPTDDQTMLQRIFQMLESSKKENADNLKEIQERMAGMEMASAKQDETFRDYMDNMNERMIKVESKHTSRRNSPNQFSIETLKAMLRKAASTATGEEGPDDSPCDDKPAASDDVNQPQEGKEGDESHAATDPQPKAPRPADPSLSKTVERLEQIVAQSLARSDHNSERQRTDSKAADTPRFRKIDTNLLPKFDGKREDGSVETFIKSIDRLLATQVVTDSDIIVYMSYMLDGPAERWMQTMPADEARKLDCWEKWRTTLRHTYLSPNYKGMIQQKAVSRRLQFEECVLDYYTEKTNLLREGFGSTWPDEAIGNAILGGMPKRFTSLLSYYPDADPLDRLWRELQKHEPNLKDTHWDATTDGNDIPKKPVKSAPRATQATTASTGTRPGTQAGNQAGNQATNGTRTAAGNQTGKQHPPMTGTERLAWLEEQRATLGRDPFRDFPPNEDCSFCDKEERHWRFDCPLKPMNRPDAAARNPATGTNTMTPAGGGFRAAGQQ